MLLSINLRKLTRFFLAKLQNISNDRKLKHLFFLYRLVENNANEPKCFWIKTVFHDKKNLT